jgi:hypothetical protein
MTDNGKDAVWAIKAQIASLQAELDRYRRALALLEPEPDRAELKPKPKKKYGPTVSSDTLNQVRNVIQELAQTQDEFTQVDVRARTGVKTSTSSIAFEVLRRNGMIRLARQQGSTKYYRLTRAQLRVTPDYRATPGVVISDNGQPEGVEIPEAQQ